MKPVIVKKNNQLQKSHLKKSSGETETNNFKTANLQNYKLFKHGCFFQKKHTINAVNVTSSYTSTKSLIFALLAKLSVENN